MNSSPISTTSSASALLSPELLEARQLRDGLANLLRAERTAAADFLLALSDFDRRRGWEPLGHASLFAFLHGELGLSKGGAYWRLSAARLLQRFPDLIDPLRDGRLCVSTTAELAKVLTKENRAEILPRYFGLSAREAKEVTAELAPSESPPLREVVTRLEPALTPVVLVPSPAAPAGRGLPAALAGEPVRTFEPGAARVAPAPDRADDVDPLTADLRRLHVTVSARLLKKIEAARDGLSHSISNATTEQVLEAALDLLLERQARARGLVKRPRKALPAVHAAEPGSEVPSDSTPLTPGDFPPHRRTGHREAIPAAVRRAVWERDAGRCCWPLDSGGYCGSTWRLELDHVDAWALGGPSTVANLRLVCHAHNSFAARQNFGGRCVERYSARPSRAETSA